MSNPDATKIIHSNWDNEPHLSAQTTLNAFRQNCHKLHIELRKWHCNNFFQIEI